MLKQCVTKVYYCDTCGKSGEPSFEPFSLYANAPSGWIECNHTDHFGSISEQYSFNFCSAECKRGYIDKIKEIIKE